MSKIMQNLITKYFTKQASLSELDELTKWIEDPSNKEEFIRYVKINHAIDFNMKKYGTDKSKRQLLKLIEQEKRAHKLGIVKNFVQYAAVILIFLGIGYFLKNGIVDNAPSTIVPEAKAPVEIVNIIQAGTDKATLTLEDGSSIDLEKGKIIKTKNIKSNGEELIYDSSNKSTKEIAYNYLTIPRGGQFHIKLADGTLVWLNSESQLKYPVAFAEGKTRIVELVYGEAYFEVSPSTEQQGATFRVLHPSQEIEVLGTEFNVKAYKDETNIYTTLVEGKVSISTATAKQILKPNQQSNLDLKNNQVSVHHADVNQEISWRRGLFSFKGKSLEEIAMVLSRWYDVDIEFSRPALRKVRFNGVLRKEEAIEEILNTIITTNSIKAYEINNKKIILK
ncbi:MAG TPA: anti-sigma factor [Arenibacter sp.]|nr:anti-sigma factor [Arenibacter sp.]|tara:strand:+ start:21195 stop:22373 length:1179 start_codon:yes stop_codon:yes gene_type:complete